MQRRAVGTPLDWPEAKKVAGHVREWGIEVRRAKHAIASRVNAPADDLCSNYWLSGSEPKARREMLYSGETRYGKRTMPCACDDADCAKIEYLVVAFDDEKKQVKLSLRQADILEALASDPELLKQGGGVPDLARGHTK